MKRAHISNGEILEFPDSVDDRTIDKAVKEHLAIKDPDPLPPNPIPSINRITTALKALFREQEIKIREQNTSIKEAIVSIKPKDYTQEFKLVSEAIKGNKVTFPSDRNIIEAISAVKLSIDNQIIPTVDLSPLEDKLEDLGKKIDLLYSILSAEKVIVKDKKGCPVGIRIKNGR